jgi:predicted outer membrane repeat protein
MVCTGLLNADPLFAYPANPIGPDGKWFTTDDGLKIVCGSPCIDAGVAVGALSGTTYKDILGTLRNLGPSHDMGAYEWIPLTGTTTRLYVKEATTGTQEGTDWTLAFKELRHALACQTITPSVAEIWVATGTYKTAGTDRAATFALKNGLALYGGFPGSGNPIFADRDPAAHVTTLSGDIGTSNDHTDNSYHVVTADNVDATAILNGFTVSHGNTQGGATTKGGGLLVNQASPLIVACTIRDNAATNGGGVAILNPILAPLTLTTLTDCTITANTAASGGGIYAEQMGVIFSGETTINSNTIGSGACQ